MKQVQLAIIGGGPAGLSAAIAARKAGVEDIDVYKRQPLEKALSYIQ